MSIGPDPEGAAETSRVIAWCLAASVVAYVIILIVGAV